MKRFNRRWMKLTCATMLATLLCSIGGVGQTGTARRPLPTKARSPFPTVGNGLRAVPQTPTRRPQGVRPPIPRVFPKRQSVQEAMVWAVPMMSYGAAAVSPDGQWVAAPIRNLGHVGIFRISDIAPARVLRAAGDPSVQRDVSSIAFSPNGQLLAVGLTDATVRLFRVSDGRELRILSEHPSAVSSVVFSPDGQWLASAPGNNNRHYSDLKA